MDNSDVPCRNGIRHALAAVIVTASFLFAGGCSTTAGNAGLVFSGIAAGSSFTTPYDEIQQTYYLGVFDPEEQIQPSFYRFRLSGQSGFLSRVRFASGWVESGFVDSLGSQIAFDKENGRLKFVGNSDETRFDPGRRMVLFGPEGFREAPRDHRLVIVMGQDPNAFFDAVGGTLKDLTTLASRQDRQEVERRLVAERHRLQYEAAALDQLSRQIDEDIDR